MNFRHTLIKVLVAVTSLLMFFGAQAQKDKVKVGFVYVGPVGDHGWTYQHDQGRLAIEQALGDKAETTYVESVAEGQDAERVIRQLASSGHDLIFTTSFGFMNPTLKVAKQFPDVKFEHATGYKRSDNVSTYAARFYEGRYIIGRIAGHMTKSNIIGYIASFPIPEVVRGINAFTLGLRSVNPDAQVKVVWVNTWYDPGKESDAAKTLVDQGADILTQHTDSPAPLQVAEERGIMGFGQASDMVKFAPNAQLTSIVDNWNDYYVARTQAVLDGNWESIDTWDGLAQGMVEMSPYAEALSDEVKQDALDIQAALTSGEMHAFQGPIKNQQGEIMVAEGENASDEMLVGMNWYVEGVDGELPQ